MANSVDPNGSLTGGYVLPAALEDWTVGVWIQPPAFVPGDPYRGWKYSFSFNAAYIETDDVDGQFVPFIGFAGAVPTGIYFDGSTKYYVSIGRDLSSMSVTVRVFVEGNATPVFEQSVVPTPSDVARLTAVYMASEDDVVTVMYGPTRSYRVSTRQNTAAEDWAEAQSATPVGPTYANYAWDDATTCSVDTTGNGHTVTMSGTGVDSSVSFYAAPTPPTTNSFFGAF